MSKSEEYNTLPLTLQALYQNTAIPRRLKPLRRKRRNARKQIIKSSKSPAEVMYYWSICSIVYIISLHMSFIGDLHI